jgi:hypothetical protein
MPERGPQPLSLPFSGKVDATGNVSIPLQGFQAGTWASWSINLSGTIGLASLAVGGQANAGPIPIHNGGATIGPVLTYGSAGCVLSVTNGNPGDIISGVLSGVSSDNLNDLSAIPGQTYSSVGTATSYDGQNLITDNSVQYTNDVTFPTAAQGGGTYDVRNFASVLLGLRLNVGGPLLITFRWYQNPDGSRLVGQRAMILNTDITTVVATIPNLGPFLQVVVNRITGGNFQWNASLVTSQRLVNDIFGGNFNPYLLEAYSQVIGPSTTSNYFLGTIYGGPVWTSVRNEGTSPSTINVTVDTFGSDGAYHLRLGNAILAVAAAATVNEITVLPPVPVRVQVVSAAIAGSYTYDLQVYSSATGGS